MPPRDDLQWIELTDFSPGIFSNNNLAGGLNVTSTNLALASPTNTVRCRSLPTGGLGPVPRRTFDFSLASVPGAGNGYTYYINGLGTWGQVFAFPATDTDIDHRIEVHLPISYTTGGTYDNVFKWVRERIYNNVPTTEVILTDTSTDGVPEQGQYAFLMKTRMNPADPLEPGQAVMVCVYGGYGQGLRVSAAHPDPATPTANSTVEVGDDTTLWRRAVAHQGRIAFGKFINYGRGATTTLSSEENIVWTETNDTALVSTTPAVFVPEVDASITDWASMSANQMVVVKSLGGGYVLQGDLSDVTVVRLPNLMSPDGADTVQGCNTPIGWVYSAGDRGLYVWNGGDSSKPLSPQLDGRSFTDTGGVAFAEGSHRGSCDRWMDLLLAPDLWMCDLETRGWWRLDDPDDAAFHDTPVCYWSSTKFNSQAVGCRARLDDDDDELFYIWDYGDLAYSYSWQSHPIWVSQDKYLTVREGLVALQGSGQVIVTVLDVNDDTNLSTQIIDVDSDVIQNFRFNVGISAENLAIRFESAGGIPSNLGTAEAPLIHRAFFGWEPSSTLANANN